MSDKTSDEGKAAPGKMLGLELVRFACAMAVLLWHYQHFYQVAGSPTLIRADEPLYGALSLLYEYGQFGVQLFWGISGFIFFWKYGAAIADRMVSGSRFFWLRFSRLYPLHIVTLLLIAALQPVHQALAGHPFVYPDNNLPNFLLNLGMATHWGAPAAFSFNGPIWSVSAEVFVYALFFLLVRMFGTSAWLIGGAIVTSIGAMLIGVESPALVCAGYFFAGGAAARLLLGSTAQGDVGGPRFVAAAMLVTVLGCAWWTGVLGEPAVLPFTLMLAVPPMLFLAAQDWPIPERWETPIQAAGNLTYSSYLCHFPLQLILAIAAAASGRVLPVASPWFLIAYLGTTLVVARLVYQRFERPAQDWIRSLTLTRRAGLARAA